MQNKKRMWLVIVGVLLLGWASLMVMGRGAKPNDVSYSKALAWAEAGQILNAEYSLSTGALVFTTQEKNNGAPQRWKTALPPMDDTTLKVLNEQGVEVNIVPRAMPSLWFTIGLTLLPILLLIGVMVYIFKKQHGGGAGVEKALGFGKSKVQMLTPNENKIRLKDVEGCDEAKAEVSEIIDFLSNPEKYQRTGAKVPRGVLMAGPPGTGKTLLAKAIAGEASCPFFFTSGSDFVEMFVGVGASRVRNMFEQAKAVAPAIIFVDEIDAVGRSRSSGGMGGNDEREQTLNALLVEMDGMKGHENIIVIAATNRPEMLDEALRRPGRFDREVNVGLPDRIGRAKILQLHSKTVPMDVDVDWEVLARGTPGFSGADLANLINEAALKAARDGTKVVSMKQLEWSRDKVIMGAEKLSGVKNEKERRITAFHEAGHAIVAYALPDTDPVHKISIVPRGRAFGVTVQLPQEDSYNTDKESMLHRIAILMGGRAAEEVVFGKHKITAGASNDFYRSTQMVRRMVTSWGMYEEIGPVSLEGESGMPMGYDTGWSNDWKRKADDLIANVLQTQYEQACQILREHREALDRVSLALLERETLEGHEFVKLMKGEPLMEVQGGIESLSPHSSLGQNDSLSGMPGLKGALT